MLKFIILMLISSLNIVHGFSTQTSVNLKSYTKNNEIITVLNREVSLHIPDCIEKMNNNSVPVVVSLHGWGSDGPSMKDIDSFDKVVNNEEQCMVVAYPTGLKRADLWFALSGFSWAAGGCCPDRDGTLNFSNDIEFVSALFQKLHQTYDKVSPDFLFISGVSNGGMLANRLACELDKVTAFASIAGPLVNGTENIGEIYQCNRKVPVLHIHGTKDPIVPFGGCTATEASYGIMCPALHGLTEFADFPDVNDYINDWKDRNQVSSQVATTTFQNNTVTCESWGTNPLDNVTLCVSTEAGHSYPGHFDSMCALPMFSCTNDIHASNEIIRFFQTVKDSLI